MRLINIDRFDNRIPQMFIDANALSLHDDVIDYMVEIAEVKAIPIEWLAKKTDEYMQRYGSVYKTVFDNILEDFRKDFGE